MRHTGFSFLSENSLSKYARKALLFLHQEITTNKVTIQESCKVEVFSVFLRPPPLNDSTLANFTIALLLDMWSVSESGVNSPSPRKNRGWFIHCLH